MLPTTEGHPPNTLFLLWPLPAPDGSKGCYPTVPGVRDAHCFKPQRARPHPQGPGSMDLLLPCCLRPSRVVKRGKGQGTGSRLPRMQPGWAQAARSFPRSLVPVLALQPCPRPCLWGPEHPECG
jgi:hypothetical protein